MSRLDPLGWTAELQASFDATPLPPRTPFLEPARVCVEHRDRYRVLTDRDELIAETSGRLRHQAASPLALPTVGDWVTIAARPHEGRATIHAVLARRGVLARKAAGTQMLPQALAANVDTVLVVTSCNQDLRACEETPGGAGHAVCAAEGRERRREMTASARPTPAAVDTQTARQQAVAPGGPAAALALLGDSRRRVALVAPPCSEPTGHNRHTPGIPSQALSPRRLERALVLAWDAGATPVVVLNKTDLSDAPAALANELSAGLPGVAVYALSAHSGDGVDALDPLLAPATTLVLLGSSGVGKSTLVNRLLGEDVMDTGGIRLHDAHGRHTTTSRHLLRLPRGALLIDTPGLREVALWGDASPLGDAFEDIASLASACHFGDCGHDTEPGCAVRAAIDAGAIDEARLIDLRKLEREVARLARKQRQRSTWEERRNNRAKTMMYRGAQNAGARKRNP